MKKIERSRGCKTNRTNSFLLGDTINIDKKKNGSHRLFLDCRGLNKQIEKTNWPLPTINDVIESLDGNC